MANPSSIHDSNWPEVWFINGYAVFMGYVLMGVRGLGVLVVTWTTVVLLGGFVSVLGKKDFWCLTGITLIQTAGVFNFLLKEKLSDFERLSWGLMGAVYATASKPFRKRKGDMSTRRQVLAFGLLLLQLLVLAAILCPLAVLYLFGLYVSAAVSLWRLIQHDFDNADGGANLKPALEVLYGLVVAQGVLFSYKTIYSFVATKEVAEAAAKQLSVDKTLVSNYLEDTVAGCEKDPSFATGRNFVTYAVDLVTESRLDDGFIAGVRILGTVIGKGDQTRLAAVKQLLTRSASFSHVIRGLIEALGPRSPYSAEIREHAARIVAHVACSIHLEQQLPGEMMMIQGISSLLDTFEEYTWRPDGYKRHSDHMPMEYERDWLLARHEREFLTDDHPRPNAASH